MIVQLFYVNRNILNLHVSELSSISHNYISTDTMASRNHIKAQVEGLNSDALRQIARDEGFSGYSGLRVDELRELVIEGRLRAAAEKAFSRGNPSGSDVEVILQQLLAKTLRQLCRNRGLHVRAATSKAVCIDTLLGRGGVGGGAGAAGDCDSESEESEPETAPRDLANAQPGDFDLVPKYQLNMLTKSELNLLAAKLSLVPLDGSVSFRNKPDAMAALSDQVRRRDLTADMRSTISQCMQEKASRAAGASHAAASSVPLRQAAPRAASDSDGDSESSEELCISDRHMKMLTLQDLNDLAASAGIVAPASSSSAAISGFPSKKAAIAGLTDRVKETFLTQPMRDLIRAKQDEINASRARNAAYRRTGIDELEGSSSSDEESAPFPPRRMPSHRGNDTESDSSDDDDPQPVPVAPAAPRPAHAAAPAATTPVTASVLAPPAPSAAAAPAASTSAPAPGAAPMVPKTHLQMLSLEQLNQLATVAGISGFPAFSKAGAVDKLNGCAPKRCLDTAMTAVIQATLDRQRQAAAARKEAALTTSAADVTAPQAFAPAPASAGAPGPAPAPSSVPARPPGESSSVPAAHLLHLPHVYLTQLASKVGVTPPHGGWPAQGGQVTKNAAVVALVGHVRVGDLDEAMQRTIANGERNAAMANPLYTGAAGVAGLKRPREEG